MTAPTPPSRSLSPLRSDPAQSALLEKASIRGWAARALIVALALFLGQPLIADTQPDAAEPSAAIPSGDQAAAKSFTDPELVIQIGRKLRCPSCQGVPIVDSPSTVAQNMMNEVRRMVAEGKTEDQIMDYYASEWGEFILLEPRSAGAWLVPLLGFFAALVGITMFLRRQTRSASASPEPDASPKTDADSDPYLDAVRQELTR